MSYVFLSPCEMKRAQDSSSIQAQVPLQSNDTFTTSRVPHLMCLNFPLLDQSVNSPEPPKKMYRGANAKAKCQNRCFHCGELSHKALDCPFRTTPYTCLRCKKMGHATYFCRQKCPIHFRVLNHCYCYPEHVVNDSIMTQPSITKPVEVDEKTENMDELVKDVSKNVDKSVKGESKHVDELVKEEGKNVDEPVKEESKNVEERADQKDDPFSDGRDVLIALEKFETIISSTVDVLTLLVATATAVKKSVKKFLKE